MNNWINIGPATDIPESGKQCTQVDGKHVVIARVNDELFCFENSCPHAGLPLEDGELRGSTIVCPFHGYTYRLKDGADVDDPQFGTPLPTYLVKEESGQILVQIQTQSE